VEDVDPETDRGELDVWLNAFTGEALRPVWFVVVSSSPLSPVVPVACTYEEAVPTWTVTPPPRLLLPSVYHRMLDREPDGALVQSSCVVTQKDLFVPELGMGMGLFEPGLGSSEVEATVLLFVMVVSVGVDPVSLRISTVAAIY
jgi:hypothetical protein